MAGDYSINYHVSELLELFGIPSRENIDYAERLTEELVESIRTPRSSELHVGLIKHIRQSRLIPV